MRVSGRQESNWTATVLHCLFAGWLLLLSSQTALGQFRQAVQAPSTHGLTGVLKTFPETSAVDVPLDTTFTFHLSRPIDPNTLHEDSVFAMSRGALLPVERGHSLDRRAIFLTFPEYLPGDAVVTVHLNGDSLLDSNGQFVDGDGDSYPGGERVVQFQTALPMEIPYPTGETLITGSVFRVDPGVIDPATGDFAIVPFNGASISVYLYPANDSSLPVASTTTGLDGSFMVTTPEFQGSENFLVSIRFMGFSETLRVVAAEANSCNSIEDAILQQLGPITTVPPDEDTDAFDQTGQVCVSIPAGAFGETTFLTVTTLDSHENLRSPVPPFTSEVGTFIDISGSDVFGHELECADCAVTMTIPNELGLPPGTEVPFGKVDHFTLEWYDLRDIYSGAGDPPDSYLGVVSPDGATISVSFDHFCTICTSYCNPYPDTEQDDDENTDNDNDPSENCGNSTIDPHEGNLTEIIALPAFRERGKEIGLSLVYQSMTAQPSARISSRVKYSTARPVERTSFTISVEGITTKATYGFSEGEDHHSNLLWDGRNVLGELLPTGAYPYTIQTTSLNAMAPIFLPATFGGQPVVDTGLNYPGLTTSKGKTVRGHAVIVNRVNSEYGSGWSLSADQRLYVSDGGALIVSGGKKTFFPAKWTLTPPGCIGTGGAPTLFAGGGGGIVFAPLCSRIFEGYESPRGERLKSTLEHNPANGGWIRTFANGTVHHFDVAGRIDRVVDRYGHELTHAYDAENRLEQITTPTGFFWTLQYDANGKIDAIVDSAGRVTDFTVDAAGDLVSVEDAESVANGDGALRTFTYDEHRLIAQQHPRGQRSEYTYTDGRVTSADAYDTDGTTLLRNRAFLPSALSNEIQAALAAGLGTLDAPIDVVSNRASIYIDGRGNPTTYEQNKLGLTRRVIDANGGVTEFEYNEEGRIVAKIGPRRVKRTEYEFDSQANIIAVHLYENTGTVENPSWTLYATTSFGYEETYSQLTEVIDACGNPTVIYRDELGRVYRAEDPLGQARLHEYEDPQFPDRPTRIITEDGATIELEYDAHGNLFRRTDELGRTLTTTNLADTGFVETVTYHGEVDPAITYHYDALNRVIQQDGGEQASVTMSYGDAGCGCSTPNLTRVTFSDGSFTEYTYDGLNRTTEIVDELGNVTSQEYDAESALVRGINRNLELVEYTYDPLGRIIESLVENGDLTIFQYDEENNVTFAANSIAVMDMEYDFIGRPITSTRTLFLESFGSLVPQFSMMTYEYDEVGNRTLFQHGGDTVSYTYDALNRLETLTSSGGESFGFGYDARGRRATLTRSNGVTTYYNHDAASQLVSLIEEGPSGTLHSIQYTDYGARGQLEAESITSSSVSFDRSYSYDSLSRLDQIDDSTTFGDLLVDVNGTFDRNQLLSDSEFTYGYDPEGRVTSKTDGTVTTGYVYDAYGQLRQITETAGGMSNDMVAEYRYDPLGRRILKSVNQVTTVFDYDGLDLVRRLGVRGNVNREFVHGPGTDEPLLFRTPEPSDTRFYHADRLGSIRMLSDSAGDSQEQLGFSAFGETLYADPGALAQPYGFTGRELDLETNVYYHRFRHLDPSLGRFLSRDPIGIAGGWNAYSYVLNDPVSFVDPFGLDGIYVHYDGYPISTPVGTLPLGHAGVVSVDPATGGTRYYEYGRYDSDFGQVKRRTIPDVTMGPDGKPTPESLENLYDYLSENYGKGKPVDAEYYDDADFQDIIDYAEQRMNDPDRDPYSWNPLSPNHCKTFAEDAVEAGQD